MLSWIGLHRHLGNPSGQTLSATGSWAMNQPSGCLHRSLARPGQRDMQNWGIRVIMAYGERQDGRHILGVSQQAVSWLDFYNQA